MYPVKQSTTLTIPVFVHDAAGDAVTGLVDGGFTKRISKNGGAFAAMTVTITEMENGWYSVPFSASHTDTLGVMSVTLTHASSKQVNLQLRVHARLPDDLAYPTTSGRSIDVTAGGTVGIDWANIESPTTTVDLSGTDINLVDTTTTNTDMRGTDSAFLAASAPTNFSDLAITVTTGQVTVGTNNDKTGYDLTSGAIVAATFGAGAIDAAAIANGAIDAATFAAGAIDAAAIATDAIDADALATDAATEMADALLNRDMSLVTVTNTRSPINALRILRNKFSIAGSTLTVTEEDDATSAWTSTITTDAAANPITASDPA